VAKRRSKRGRGWSPESDTRERPSPPYSGRGRKSEVRAREGDKERWRWEG